MKTTIKLRSPGVSVHTVELSRTFACQSELDELCRKIEKYYPIRRAKDNRWEVHGMDDCGIRMSLLPESQGDACVFIVVNLQKLIADDYCPADIIPAEKELLREAWKCLERRLKAIGLTVDECKLTRVDICGNLTSKEKNFVREYLRLMRKRRNRGWMERKPFWDRRLSLKENRQCDRDYYRVSQKGESLVFYDKRKQAERLGLKGWKQVPRGLLRIEWQLERKTLKAIEGRTGLERRKLVFFLAQHGGELLAGKLRKTYWSGMYLKAEALMSVIEESAYQDGLKELMKWYVKKAKKWGEDKAAKKLLAREEWSVEEYGRFRSRFEKLNIQPVPLRKNFCVDELEPPEVCLVRLLEEDAAGGIF